MENENDELLMRLKDSQCVYMSLKSYQLILEDSLQAFKKKKEVENLGFCLDLIETTKRIRLEINKQVEKLVDMGLELDIDNFLPK
jgi:hypothetical protein